MQIEQCDCGGFTYKIYSQSMNGGYTAEKQCTQCGKVTEIIDTYNDN